MTLEERRLLNPAFGAVLVARAAYGFMKEATSGLPFVYAYLLLPLLLHPETRGRLPISVVTKLVSWTERNGDLVAPVPHRVRELATVTRDSVFLASTAGIIALGTAAEIQAILTEKELLKFERASASVEIGECMRKAYFIGRWLATSGTVPTVMTALGVQL
jgi:ABC-3C biological conflict system middle component